MITAGTHLLAAANSPLLTTPNVNYTAILPELILLGGMLLMITVSALTVRQRSTEFFATMTFGTGVAALISSLVLWHDVTSHGGFTAIADSVDIDGFGVFILVLVSSLLIVASLLAPAYLRREHIGGCEYYALALISGSGAMLMGTANDLILVFLALEILSIPLYVLAGFDQRKKFSGEAAMKYFVLGAFSSAIFVYGIALVYGATGSTNLAEIPEFLAHNVVVSNGVLMGGIALLLVGFGFKVAAVPFHMWTPDVYQGSPTTATGFMAAMAKAGGFAALLRVFVSAFPTQRLDWQPVVWAIAVLTLVLGAVLAIVQGDIKRMLAYSSINHAGFILLGLQAATARGVASSLYYVFVYGFLVLGSFAVVDLVSGVGDESHGITDYRGLARRNPILAVVFAVLLLAQAGAPFTTGFFAKFYVIEASVGAHSYALAVIAMATAAIAAFAYLRIIFFMFGVNDSVPEPGDDGELVAVSAMASPRHLATARAAVAEVRINVPAGVGAALFCIVGISVVFGVWPAPIIDFARQATLLF